MRLIYLLIITLLISSFDFKDYSVNEQRLKFLFIKNFIKNIEWPQNSKRNEFKIGVLGEKDIYNKIAMSNIKPEYTNKASVAFYYFNTAEDLLNCQLIYIPASRSSEIPKVVRYYQNQATLIVSESKNACEFGAMINFYENSSFKISFEYNPEAIESSGLFYSKNFMEQGKIYNPLQ